MDNQERELDISFTRKRKAQVVGSRIESMITHNPTSYKPGEDIYVEVPRLGPNESIFPGALDLVFDFNVTGTKSHFKNNLSRQLQKRLQIKAGGESVYDNGGESVFSTYEDLWKTKAERSEMKLYGVASQNYRKLVSNDDTAAKTGDDTKVSEALVSDLYGKQQRINLGYLMRDNGLYSPYNMANHLTYTISLPEPKEVLVAQGGETLGTYSLDNVQLKHRSLLNASIASDSGESYSQRSIVYDHRTLAKTFDVEAASTQINESIIIPRRRMKAIILIFTKHDRSDSEEFVYPNIDKVNITINGTVNQIFTKGMTVHDMYPEAKGLFNPGSSVDQNITESDYFKDKYALVVDLRPTQNKNLFANGKEILNSMNGIGLEIIKKAHTGKLKCQLFIEADGVAQFENRHYVKYQV